MLEDLKAEVPNFRRIMGDLLDWIPIVSVQVDPHSRVRIHCHLTARVASITQYGSHGLRGNDCRCTTTVTKGTDTPFFRDFECLSSTCAPLRSPPPRSDQRSRLRRAQHPRKRPLVSYRA